MDRRPNEGVLGRGGAPRNLQLGHFDGARALEGIKAWRKKAGVEKGRWGGGGFEPNGWFSLGLGYSTYKMEGMILMTSFLEGLSGEQVDYTKCQQFFRKRV